MPGLGDELANWAVRPETARELRRWEDGRVLFVEPMGQQCGRRYGTHCYVAHRADLLALCRQAVPPHLLRLDRRCVGMTQLRDEVAVAFVSSAGHETKVPSDAVVGADGIHPVIRAAIAPKIAADFSGLCAFRCLPPAEKAPAMARRPVQTLWLGPGRHFVHHPISGGRRVDVVAIAPAGDGWIESWTADGEITGPIEEFDGWDSRLHQLITSAANTSRWALYDRAPLERWTGGRISLPGDAAHAMLPFFARGAARAIEDAAVLADCPRASNAGAVPQALHRYEEIRRPRASQVQLMSRGREVRNHLPDGPEQRRRDAESLANLHESSW